MRNSKSRDNDSWNSQRERGTSLLGHSFAQGIKIRAATSFITAEDNLRIRHRHTSEITTPASLNVPSSKLWYSLSLTAPNTTQNRPPKSDQNRKNPQHRARQQLDHETLIRAAASRPYSPTSYAQHTPRNVVSPPIPKNLFGCSTSANTCFAPSRHYLTKQKGVDDTKQEKTGEGNRLLIWFRRRKTAFCDAINEVRKCAKKMQRKRKLSLSGEHIDFVVVFRTQQGRPKSKPLSKTS